MEYFTLIFIPLLTLVIYTDFRRYKVHAFVLFLLLGLSIARLVIMVQPEQYIQILGLNFILLATLFAAVALVARLRKKSFIQMMGSGDIIFLGIAALNFAPMFFNLFIVIATLTSLGFIILRSLKDKVERRVPFAGIMAVTLIGFILFDVFSTFSCYNDNRIMQILVG